MRLSDLTWPELDAMIKAGPPILILPPGSLEQHGPHLPLGTDT
ncbi:MAG: creatininase family protein, partial [Paracoccaceae bacterium]